MSATLLPLELLDYIFELLRTDPGSLKACHVVFPNLVERHLFAVLTLSNLPAPIDPSPFSNNDGHVVNIRDFGMLLVKTPFIANIVRSLKIDICSADDTSLELIEDLTSILPKLLRVECFTLRRQLYCHDVYWLSFSSLLRSTFITFIRSPTITEVSVSYFSSFPLAVFDECKSLKKLSFLGLSCDLEPSLSTYPQLDTLRVIYGQYPLTKFISWGVGLRTLILNVRINSQATYSGFRNFMRACSKSLLDLEFFFEANTMHTPRLEAILDSEIPLVSLPALPALKKLSIYSKISITKVNDRYISNLPTVSHLLHKLPIVEGSPTKRISLSIYLHFNFPPPSPNLEKLDLFTLVQNLLPRSNFRHPIEIHISVSQPYTLVPVPHVLSLFFIDSELSRLMDDGIFVITACDRAIWPSGF